jgi:ABC-2 type transport system ATP-binding protein
VILDEPFSGLDPVNTDVLTEIVLDLRREGRTVIFSTHVMEQAEKLCDSVFMICRGEKVLDGPIDEIRRQFSENTLDVTGEGDVAALAALPGVRDVRDLGGRVEVFLEADTDPQEVLRGLLPHWRVRTFELRAPTLHDIFVRIAGSEAVAGVPA